MNLQDELKSVILKLKGKVLKPVVNLSTISRHRITLHPESSWVSLSKDSEYLYGLCSIPHSYIHEYLGTDVKVEKVFNDGRYKELKSYYEYILSSEWNHGYTVAEKLFLVSNYYGEIRLYNFSVWVGMYQFLAYGLGGIDKCDSCLGVVSEDFQGIPIENEALFSEYLKQKNCTRNNTAYFGGRWEDAD